VKGIILAGGTGSRLYPMTMAVSKQLLPIYDKPMIYYPISILMLADIRDILIISTPNDLPVYEKLLSDGSKIGLKFSYRQQDSPRGLADAFILGESFIGDDSVCLILGDNIFYGGGITLALKEAIGNLNNGIGATIFGYPVKDPKAFGVVEFDKNKEVISIEEKPEHPKSNFAVPGLYFYDNKAIEIAKGIKPSARGEIEITSINNEYLNKKQLKVSVLGRGMAWLDTGTVTNMMQASAFVQAVQQTQGYHVACIEEIAYRQGFIDIERLKEIGESMKSTEYGRYLETIYREENKIKV
jgi:glucose-1-phosphate thymidylyltransferase